MSERESRDDRHVRERAEDTIVSDRLQSALTEVLRQIQTQAIEFVRFQGQVSALLDDMKRLDKIVHEDGERSLVVRTAILERIAHETTETLKQLVAREKSRSEEDQKGRWQLAGAFLTGLLGLIAALTVAFMNGK